MKKRLPRVLALGVLAAMAAAQMTAATFVELGDAGRTLATARLTGTGALDTILGLLDENPPDTGRSVDLFVIKIVDPAGFSASTAGFAGLTVEDPQLFLFDSLGMAVYMNDDDESGLNGSQSLLPAGHAFGPMSGGIYYLGIGWFNNEPFSTLGMMFDTASATGTNGPGLGGASPLVDWNDDVTQRIDIPVAYQINLTGAFAVPEPATAALILFPLGLICLLRRHRRTRGRSR